MCTASSALAGYSLHCPGHRVIPPWNESAWSTTKVQFFQKYCLWSHACGTVLAPIAWQAAFIPLFGNLQHCTDSSVSSRNYWKDFVSYETNAPEISYMSVHLMAVLLFTAVRIACLAGSCYYSLRGVNSAHQCFRPIKMTDLGFLFLYAACLLL